MDLIVRFGERLIEIRDKIPGLISEIIDENASMIEDLNIAQLQHGMRADGEILPDYSPRSVEFYGKPPGPIKLYDSGDFYRGITAGVFQSKFELIGQDSKTDKLKQNFGGPILGLTDENFEYLKNEIILPELIKKIQSLLS